MKKYGTTLFALYIGLIINIQGQVIDPKNEFNNCNIKLNGVYGLSEFVKFDNRLPVEINDLTIKFDSLNKLIAIAGNVSCGRYYLCNSGQFIIDSVMTTTVYITAETKSGFIFLPDLFADSLFAGNRFINVNGEIRIFRDSSFRLSLKPYYDLLPFKNRFLSQKRVIEIAIDSMKDIAKPVLINTKKDFNLYSIRTSFPEIDFTSKSLIVISNKDLKHVKQKDLRILYKTFKQTYTNAIFPTSYAKLYEDKNRNKLFLDIVNTYTRASRFEKRRGKYTAFLIDKVNDINKININVKYIK